MRLRKTLGITVVAMAMFAVAGTAAIAKDYRNVMLHYDATLAGSHLASGTYHVEWQTHSPEATVTFTHGSKVVATAEGKVVDRGTKFRSDQVVYNEGPNGTRVIRKSASKDQQVIEFNQ